MPRAKRGNKRLERRKKILKLAKGYRGTKSKLYRSAKESVERGLNFAYTGRKLKKRDFRSLWIVRIGAAARLNGINYSQLMHGLKLPAWNWIVKCLPIWPSTNPRLSRRWRCRRRVRWTARKKRRPLKGRVSESRRDEMFIGLVQPVSITARFDGRQRHFAPSGASNRVAPDSGFQKRYLQEKIPQP